MITLQKYLVVKALTKVEKVLEKYVRYVSDSDDYLGIVEFDNVNNIYYSLKNDIVAITDYELVVSSIVLNNDTITLTYTAKADDYAFNSEANLNDILENEKIPFSDLENYSSNTNSYGDYIGIASNNNNDLLVRTMLKDKGYTWESGDDLEFTDNKGTSTLTMCYSLHTISKTITYSSFSRNYTDIDFEKNEKYIQLKNVYFNNDVETSNIKDNVEYDEIDETFDYLDNDYVDDDDEHEKHYCDVCGREFDDDKLESLGDYDYVCYDCKDNGWYCEKCGKWHSEYDDLCTVRTSGGYDEDWCEDCYNNCAFYCNGYDRNYDCDYYDSVDINGTIYSEDYANNYFHYCDSCETWVIDDDCWNYDQECCTDCETTQSEYIRDYHYSPDLYFYGKIPTNVKSNHYHIGCELEIDKNDGYGDSVGLIDKLNELVDSYNDELYYEHDGSLDYGFEIITQPHTYQAFMNMRWEEILGLCSSYGYKSHDTNTCGLHLHISREFFGRTKDEQDRAIAKLLIFFDSNYNEIVKVSRRKNDLNWCGKYFTNNNYVKVELNENTYKPNTYYYKTWFNDYLLSTDNHFDSDKTYYKKVALNTKEDFNSKEAIELAKSETKKSLCHDDRYKAVNLTNKNTIEFRIMKGTLNPNTFRACINFLYRVAMNSKHITFRNIADNRLWLKGIDESTKAYLKMRNAFLDVIGE